jgi:hypothetical protein
MTGWTAQPSYLAKVERLRVTLPHESPAKMSQTRLSLGWSGSDSRTGSSLRFDAPRFDPLPKPSFAVFPRPLLSPYQRAILGPSADAVEAALQGVPNRRAVSTPLPVSLSAQRAEHVATMHLGTGAASAAVPTWTFDEGVDFSEPLTRLSNGRLPTGWVPEVRTLGQQPTEGGVGSGVSPYDPGAPSFGDLIGRFLGRDRSDSPFVANWRSHWETREKRLNSGSPEQRAQWRYLYAKWDQLNRTA